MFQKINTIFVTSFFIILAIITLYPLLWIFTLSLKGFSEYMLGNIWGLPKILTLENYRSVLMNTNFIRNFYNSAIVTIGSLLIVVPVGAMVSKAIFLRPNWHICSYKDGASIFKRFINGFSLSRLLS